MIVKKIRRWMKKHWFIFIKKPTNGHASLVELDSILQELNGNVCRVSNLIKKMNLDNREAKRMINDNVSSHNNS